MTLSCLPCAFCFAPAHAKFVHEFLTLFPWAQDKGSMGPGGEGVSITEKMPTTEKYVYCVQSCTIKVTMNKLCARLYL